MLVIDGEAFAAVQPNEQVYSAVDWGRQPRSVIAQDADGATLLLTIDGRTEGAGGLSTPSSRMAGQRIGRTPCVES